MAKLFIAGEYVDSESKESTPVRNPATGEVVDTVQMGTVNDVRRAIDVAKGALKKWSENGPIQTGRHSSPSRSFDFTTGEGTGEPIDP